MIVKRRIKGRTLGLRPLEPPASALLRRGKPVTETKWLVCRTLSMEECLRALLRRSEDAVLNRKAPEKIAR